MPSSTASHAHTTADPGPGTEAITEADAVSRALASRITHAPSGTQRERLEYERLQELRRVEMSVVGSRFRKAAQQRLRNIERQLAEVGTPT